MTTVGEIFDLPADEQYPDDNRGPLLLRVVWILLGLSSIAVAARTYVKIRTTRRVYWDDGLMILAWIFGLVYSVMVSMSVKYGYGRHLEYLQVADLSQTFRYGILSLAWGILSPTAGRLAFCIFILWLSGTDPNIKRWPFYVIMAIQVVVNIAAIILWYAQCGLHLSILWTPALLLSATNTCWNFRIQTYYGYAFGTVNSLTDLFMTILPAVIVTHAKMTVQSKLGLACLLCLSGVAMVASIVKTIQAKNLSTAADETYDLVSYYIWISVELNVVMIVASVPILRPLFTRQGITRLARLTTGMSNGSRSTQTDMELKERNSVYSTSRSGKGQERNGVSRNSNAESEENILPQTYGITKTVEVSVTRDPGSVVWVHAALVGLPSEF